VGSFKPLRLSTDDIVRRYRDDGECVGMLALRARVPVYRINEVLTAAGIRLRGPSERLRLAAAQRRARR
jgi:hypothetical protein